MVGLPAVWQKFHAEFARNFDGASADRQFPAAGECSPYFRKSATRGCVKRLFGRRVRWLTGEFGLKSRLKLHLRG
jgi:hypothetical protein